MVERPGLSVAADRAVHEPRIDGVHGRPREAEFLEAPGFHVLNEDVASSEKAPERIGAMRTLQVQRETALAAIDAEEVRTPRANKRAPSPGIVACARFLDLDDVGAHVPKEHGTEGAGKHSCQVYDSQSIKRRHLGAYYSRRR